MACRTPSVQRAADKTVSAGQQIDKLEAMIKAQDNVHKDKFFADITSHFAAAKVTDGREIGYNSETKTEYTSEFSLDKIAGVVTSALKALAAAKDPTVATPALGPEAIAAYSDLVNTVAEAAKSSSDASASLSFSMNRLSPGLFAFLCAYSVNIQDDETFGSEAVTSTSIYYRFMQSIDDIKQEAAFGAAMMDAKTYNGLKKLQAALVDDLASGKITLEVWETKDTAYSLAAGKVKARLDAAHFNTSGGAASFRVAPGSHIEHEGSPESQAIVSAAIDKLVAKGNGYRSVISVSKARLSSLYY